MAQEQDDTSYLGRQEQLLRDAALAKKYQQHFDKGGDDSSGGSVLGSCFAWMKKNERIYHSH